MKIVTMTLKHLIMPDTAHSSMDELAKLMGEEGEYITMVGLSDICFP